MHLTYVLGFWCVGMAAIGLAPSPQHSGIMKLFVMSSRILHYLLWDFLLECKVDATRDMNLASDVMTIYDEPFRNGNLPFCMEMDCIRAYVLKVVLVLNILCSVRFTCTTYITNKCT